jgi:hypothetical protein
MKTFIFLIALAFVIAASAKPVIRHPKATVDEFQKYLQQNPTAEDFVIWQKAQIQNDLNQTTDIEFCLSHSKSKKRLSKTCIDGIDTTLQSPLNQNSQEMLEYLFEKMQSHETDLEKYNAFYLGLISWNSENNFRADQIQYFKRKLRKQFGFERAEILINGVDLELVKSLNPKAQYQFVVVADTTTPIIKLATAGEFEKLISDLSLPEDPFKTCHNKDVEFPIVEFEVLFPNFCLMSYPLGQQNNFTTAFKPTRDEFLNWKWLAVVGALAAGIYLKDKTVTVTLPGKF